MAELRARRPTALGAPRAPSLAEVESWIGWRVDDVHGCMIGRVESILRNASGEPSWLVVSEFRFGDGRRFMIPASDAVGGSGRVWSPHGRERIRATSGMVGSRFTPQADRRLTSHYLTGREPAARRPRRLTA
jgi:hypothetical protein